MWPRARAYGRVRAREVPSQARSRICATAAIRRRCRRIDAAEYLGAGGGAGDLLDFGFAATAEQAYAEREGARYIALLLDRVAVRDPSGASTGREHHLDLSDRGRIERRAELCQELQDLGIGVSLHRIEDARVRQRLGEGLVVGAYHFEVDDRQGPSSVRRRRNSRIRCVTSSFLHSNVGRTRQGSADASSLAGVRTRRAGEHAGLSCAVVTTNPG